MEIAELGDGVNGPNATQHFGPMGVPCRAPPTPVVGVGQLPECSPMLESCEVAGGVLVVPPLLFEHHVEATANRGLAAVR